MSQTSLTNAETPSFRAKGYEPEAPISVSPIFEWPPKPLATLKYLVKPMMLPYGVFWIVVAVFVWNFLTPSMERMATLQPRWILELYLRNAAMWTVVAGGLHLLLYMKRAQQQRYKYSPRWQSTTNRSFLWTNQVKDNIFWSLIFGCGIWTIYEALTLWGYASGWIPSVEWGSAWPYLGALTVGVFFWSVTHFYLQHRLLHVRWFYDHAHYLHHRNVNSGPWGGLSSHPLEHVIYFSVFLLWWVVPAHPYIVILMGTFSGLAPAISHSGFDRFEFWRQKGNSAARSVAGGDYFHQLHHKYFECNYGNRPMPFDKLFNTFHDGTPDAHSKMKQRMLSRRKFEGERLGERGAHAKMKQRMLSRRSPKSASKSN